MFQKNDYIIYGNNGVCIVKDIGTLDMPGIPKERIYYTLIPCYKKDSQIFVPADNCKVIMRPIIRKEEVLQLIEEIPSIELLWIEDEKQRETRYKEALRKCDCRELIRVIKTIRQRGQKRIAQGKKITASDEKYYQLAEDSLYGEIAVALGMKERAQARDFITGKVKELREEQPA